MAFPKFTTPITIIAVIVLLATTSLTAFNEQTTKLVTINSSLAKYQQQTPMQLVVNYPDRLDIYKEVTLSADLSHLSINQKNC